MQFSQSFNYNMDRTNTEKELLIPHNGWNLMKIALTPSVIGNYPVSTFLWVDDQGKIVVRNLLNDTRALTFKLQATICREVDFQILSPQPISLGSFPLSTAGQGFIKLLNPTARDLSYTISAQNVELLLGDLCSQEGPMDRKEGGTQINGTQGGGTQVGGTQIDET